MRLVYNSYGFDIDLTNTESKLEDYSYKYSMSMSYLRATYSELNKLVYINGYVTFRPRRECEKDMGSSRFLCLTSLTSLQPSDFTLYEGEAKTALNCQRTSYDTNLVVNYNPKYVGCAVLSSLKEVKSFEQALISDRHGDGGKHHGDDGDDDFEDYLEIFGYIVGGIAAFVLFIGCLVALCCICICKRRKKVGSVAVEMCGNNGNVVVQGIPVDSNGQPIFYPPPPLSNPPVAVNGDGTINDVHPIVYQPPVYLPTTNDPV